MSTIIITAIAVKILDYLAPPIADKFINWLISQKGIYIDRVNISQKDGWIIFDITSSSSLDQETSITKFEGTLRKPNNVVGINGVKEISSTYKVYSLDGENIVEVNQELFSGDAKVWDSGRTINFSFPLLENQHTKSTNRFRVEWKSGEDVSDYKTIQAVLYFTFYGKSKATEVTMFKNSLFIDTDTKKTGHKIYGTVDKNE